MPFSQMNDYRGRRHQRRPADKENRLSSAQDEEPHACLRRRNEGYRTRRVAMRGQGLTHSVVAQTQSALEPFEHVDMACPEQRNSSKETRRSAEKEQESGGRDETEAEWSFSSRPRAFAHSTFCASRTGTFGVSLAIRCESR